MRQIIHLSPDDDVASIRAKIEMAELSHLVLVVPHGCVALESEHGLQLLRRAAEDAGVEIGLVALDAPLRERAGRFGFPLFSSVNQAQESRWRMDPLSRDVVQGELDGDSEPSPIAVLGQGRDGYKQLWMGLTVAIVFVCMLCAVTVVFVPAANVRVTPALQGLTLTTEITADPTISQKNTDTRTAPARRITKEINGTAQLKTTTEKSIPNAPSTGTVIFTNIRGDAKAILPGAVVMTSAGIPIRFTTTTTVTMPAGVNSRVEAPIQAVEPGPTGNVKELAINTIEGSLSLDARVINLKATASGSLKPVKVVTADDKKKLEAQLLQQLRQQAQSVLTSLLKEGEFLPNDSVLVDVYDETYDRSVDDPADMLNLRITGTAIGLGVDLEDAQALVAALLQKQMQPGYNLQTSQIQITPQAGGKYQGVALKMPIKAGASISPQIDPGKLAVALQGKSVDEAQLYLAQNINLARPPEITITPAGWNRFPWMGFRIAVFVDQPTAGAK